MDNTPDDPEPSTSTQGQQGSTKAQMKEKINHLVSEVNERLAKARLDHILIKLYYSPSHPASFGSWEKLYQAAVKQDPRLTRFYVKQWLSIQPTYASFKQMRGRFKRRKVLVRGVQHQYQADTLDVFPYHKSNEGYKYLLTILDCFSRKATAIPLKTKKGEEMSKALTKAFKYLGKPTKIQTDRGSEFYNSTVQALFKREKIIHFSTKQNVKAQMVERFNRTIRNKIRKYTAANKSYHYLKALPDLVESYNHAVHRALKKWAPHQVNKKNEDQVRQVLYEKYFNEKKDKPKFKIGDVVQVVSQRLAFDKTSPAIGKKRYVVTDVIHKFNPPMYSVQGEKDKIAEVRPIYAEEMHKIHTELEE